MEQSETCVKISDDDGATWHETARMSHELGMLFEYQGRLHLLGSEAGRGDMLIVVSDDEGDSWQPAVVLHRGRFWNTSSGKVICDNRLYWCFGAPNEEGEFNTRGSRTLAVVADLTRDLTNVDAWRFSEYLTYPGTPALLRRGLNDPYHDHWLEGNVVIVKGQLRVHWRVRIDGYATVGICAICDLNDDGTRLDYRFAQFYPLPGGQNHFHIICDDATGIYWMTTTLPSHSQDQEFGGNQRRILALYCSFDALNWLPAGYLIIWPSLRQSSNYVTPLIDGNDMLFASRTSHKAPNSHDNDLVTFHRVTNFRELATRLIPEV